MKHFPGSTKRQRNINLSGKSKPSSGLIVARGERARREAERQRVAAATKIQSTYRGYAIRYSVRRARRADWDRSVGFPAALPPTDHSDDSLALLLSFCDAADTEDVCRLVFIISAFHLDDEPSSLIGLNLAENSRHRLLITRLFRVLLVAVSSISVRHATTLTQALRILPFLSCAITYFPEQADTTYFETIAGLIDRGLIPHISTFYPLETRTATLAIILQSIVLPLRPGIRANRPLAYTNFVQVFLTTASLDTNLFSAIPVSILRKLLDIRQLLEAATQLRVDQLSPEQILWLLSYLIAFVYDPELLVSSHHLALQDRISSHPLYQKADITGPLDSRTICGLLATTLNPILDAYGRKIRNQTSTPDRQPIVPSRAQAGLFVESEERLNPPEFVQRQLKNLLETDFISNLADGITWNWTTPSSSTQTVCIRHAAQRFTLHLLLYFRFLEQKLHNRLFLARSQDDMSLLATLYHQVQNTHTFRDGVAGVDAILDGLKLTHQKTGGTALQSSEWTTILLFLDLYCFSNIVMDDEEFFTLGDKSLQSNQLRHLVDFLKNLAFVAYFEVSEIESQVSDEPLQQLFTKPTRALQLNTRLDVAGIHGVSLPWIRNLAIRILRSLHRRDSRQKFLPDGFWLMKQINTEGTTHLIAEEEARQQELEQSSNIEESDSDSDTDDVAKTTSANSNIARRPNRRHERTLRDNYLAAITPRLGVIQNLPFFLPFRTRVSIFRDFIKLDQARRGTGDRDLWRLSQANPFQDQPGTKSKHHGIIHRDRMFEDAYDEFYALGESFKEPIQITFVDSFGAEEPGIDGGGILKEFLSCVVQELSRTDTARSVPFFTETEDHTIYPNPFLLDELPGDFSKLENNSTSDLQIAASREAMDLLRRIEFLGRIIGKCMYEGILVEVVFADFFLLKWSKVMLGNDDVGLGVDDLKRFDRSLWKGLQALKHYDEQTIKDLDLTFAIENILRVTDSRAPTGVTQKIVLVDLKPGGSQIPVTSSNRLEYIHLVSKYKLAAQGKQQTNAFLKGLSSIISPRWLSMFNQSELQTLIGGNESPLDIDDLRKNTIYGGIYTIGDDKQEHETIKMFWRVLKRLRESDKRAVLKFVTSVSRAPLLGFSSLNPRFSIRDAGSDSTRLPSTSTCVNLLKLPRYPSETVLEEKLLYAANAGAGFDLS
ncbi:hypothetical protein TWF970_010638 [Orbilia oligospora]|uniref:HECT-type E3 ubiquitin transferase n=1 Tax=Orbilia oligospora TaxID=2813651 RepID=A0A7C8VHI0_ORBOL|nr:hypothetical protein TWF970_010638 [Orbilia oligospora]